MEVKILEIINKIRNNKDLENLEKLTDDMNLRSDLGLDSLDLAELTVRIENEFEIDVFEDSIITTIGQLFQKLNGK